MEANASGVPVLANPVGGIPEMISDGINGYLVSPSQADRIADILAGWRINPEVFRELRSSTRALAESRFDRNRMMDGYATAFAEWIESPSRPPAVLGTTQSPTSLTISTSPGNA
jgi:glycosyltransferase involved in cell wall biosynthesis